MFQFSVGIHGHKQPPTVDHVSDGTTYPLHARPVTRHPSVENSKGNSGNSWSAHLQIRTADMHNGPSVLFLLCVGLNVSPLWHLVHPGIKEIALFLGVIDLYSSDLPHQDEWPNLWRHVALTCLIRTNKSTRLGKGHHWSRTTYQVYVFDQLYGCGVLLTCSFDLLGLEPFYVELLETVAVECVWHACMCASARTESVCVCYPLEKSRAMCMPVAIVTSVFRLLTRGDTELYFFKHCLHSFLLLFFLMT